MEFISLYSPFFFPGAKEGAYYAYIETGRKQLLARYKIKEQRRWHLKGIASVRLILGVSHESLEFCSCPFHAPSPAKNSHEEEQNASLKMRILSRSNMHSTSPSSPMVAVVVNHQSTTSTYQISHTGSLVTSMIIRVSI